MGTRVTVLVWIFSLAFAFLGYRFYDVQLSQGDYYGKQASASHTIGGYLIPKRGSIYFSDKDGEQVPAAVNKEYPVVYAVPSEVEDPIATATTLASIVEDMSQSDLEALLSKQDDPYEPLIKRPTEVQTQAVKEASLPGIYIGSGLDRFYPLCETVAPIL